MNVLVKEGILGAILLIVGVFDRLYIDWYWVGRTKVWIIPGTEDLMPCMPQSDRGARRVSWWHGAIVSGGIAALRCRPIYNTDGTITQPASLTALLQREPFARHCHKSFIIYTIHPR